MKSIVSNFSHKNHKRLAVLVAAAFVVSAVSYAGCSAASSSAAAEAATDSISSARNTPAVYAAKTVGPAVVGITNKAIARDWFDNPVETEGVGSGVINDLTKLTAHRCGRRYMCVGTAASMDGYTAYGASITYQGNKQTFDCPAPYGMALDPRIAAKAPKAMSASGYADLIAKIPAGADWMIADVVGSEAIDRFAFDLVQDGLQEALSDPEGVYNGDVKKVEQLAEGLLLSGFAMQAAKSSRPASGMEHQFSHFWDMEDLEFEGKHVSHGFKVGIGTLASTASLELLLAAPIESLDIDACVAKWKSWEETEKEILRIFDGKPGFIDRALTETKNKYVDKEGLRRELTAFKAAWPELKERIRKQIIPFEEVRRRLKLVGAPYEPEQLGVSRARFRDTFAKIPYMRSRFSNIDIAYRCGFMDEWLERLFGKGGIWEVE